MKVKFAALILAAGRGLRMKSSLPKVLHPLAGKPLLFYPIHVARQLGVQLTTVVVPPQSPEITDFCELEKCKVAVQREPKGTAHAVLAAAAAFKSFQGYMFLLCGDVPLVTEQALRKLADEVLDHKAKLGLISFLIDRETGYGRLVRNSSGQVCEIVEVKGASEQILRIREVNAGVYCVDARWLFAALAKIKPNPVSKEYYLTDIVKLASEAGEEIVVHQAQDETEFLGVNSQEDLENVSRVMRARINKKHMANGVRMIDSSTTYIDSDVVLASNVVLFPNVHLYGKTSIDEGCVLETGTIIKDSLLKRNVTVHAMSSIEESMLHEEVSVGPFARIRPQTELGKKVKIGNFVEVKKSKLAEGVKASHLSYLGDATIGKNTNIGCGTITCNYDGRQKHQTIIGEGAFVGSDTQFVAPVKIGSHVTIGAGSTITKDVPAKALALSRVAQTIVPNWKPKKKKR